MYSCYLSPRALRNLYPPSQHALSKWCPQLPLHEGIKKQGGCSSGRLLKAVILSTVRPKPTPFSILYDARSRTNPLAVTTTTTTTTTTVTTTANENARHNRLPATTIKQSAHGESRCSPLSRVSNASWTSRTLRRTTPQSRGTDWLSESFKSTLRFSKPGKRSSDGRTLTHSLQCPTWPWHYWI